MALIPALPATRRTIDRYRDIQLLCVFKHEGKHRYGEIQVG